MLIISLTTFDTITFFRIIDNISYNAETYYCSILTLFGQIQCIYSRVYFGYSLVYVKLLLLHHLFFSVKDFVVVKHDDEES